MDTKLILMQLQTERQKLDAAIDALEPLDRGSDLVVTEAPKKPPHKTVPPEIRARISRGMKKIWRDRRKQMA